MIALRFQFVAGRWHATAWGSHVNEGVPDWPPEGTPSTRNRRPPTDPVNALLSLAYSLLAKECTLAACAVGLDPYVGFYHGGTDQIFFGTTAAGLTADQLALVTFMNPLGLAPGSYQATLLSTGNSSPLSRNLLPLFCSARNTGLPRLPPPRATSALTWVNIYLTQKHNRANLVA